MKHFFVLITLIFILFGTQGTISAGIAKTDVIDLVNRDRLAIGLNPLTEDPQLTLAAQAKVQEMFSHDLFDHYMPDGHTPWDFILTSGYDFAYAGENLAMGWLTAENQHYAWMGSATHRQNILNPLYEDTGVAVVEGVLEGLKTTLVVQLFGQTADQDFNLDNLTVYLGRLLGVE